MSLVWAACGNVTRDRWTKMTRDPDSAVFLKDGLEAARGEHGSLKGSSDGDPATFYVEHLAVDVASAAGCEK